MMDFTWKSIERRPAHSEIDFVWKCPLSRPCEFCWGFDSSDTFCHKTPVQKSHTKYFFCWLGWVHMQNCPFRLHEQISPHFWAHADRSLWHVCSYHSDLPFEKPCQCMKLLSLLFWRPLVKNRQNGQKTILELWDFNIHLSDHAQIWSSQGVSAELTSLDGAKEGVPGCQALDIKLSPDFQTRTLCSVETRRFVFWSSMMPNPWNPQIPQMQIPKSLSIC